MSDQTATHQGKTDGQGVDGGAARQDIWTRLRLRLGIRSSDEFINHRPAENLTMLRQRLAQYRAELLICKVPDPGDPVRAIHDELVKLLDKPLSDTSWDDAQRCEMLLARLMPETELPAAIDAALARLATIAPKRQEALKRRWDVIQSDKLAHDNQNESDRRAGKPEADLRPFDLEAAGARGVLNAALEDIQRRDTQSYLIRKLGVIYAARIVGIFALAILIGLILVVWEVYFRSWPLRDAKFSGFAMALTAGLLGASFSALTKQRTVTELDTLEDVRTAIGYPMIILRLGVGVSAAAILYFFFESGLVESVIFPDLNAIGFEAVARSTVIPAGEQPVLVSVDTLRASVALAGTETAEAAEKLAALVNGSGARTPDGVAARLAQEALKGAQVALAEAGGALEGAQTNELGRFAPNAALSQLVVWSFLAGFSQTLVPNILGKLEEGGGQRQGG